MDQEATTAAAAEAPTSPAGGPDASSSSSSSAPPHVTPDSTTTAIGGDDYQNQIVKDPVPNDVLCGRGGSINSHPGNERFRQLVDKRKRVYLTARFKREKRLIASSIVSEIRGLNPPGRFLSQDKKTAMWKDIGDEKARDKTSQALRENAPTIRAEIETEINEQRDQMKKEDDKVAVAAAPQQQQPPPQHAPPHPGHAPPSASPYYGGWGPYPYYGYSQHPPPPPPPHHHHPGYYPHPHAPPPPQPTTSEQQPPPTWGSFYPPPPHATASGSSDSTPPPPKSAIEQTAEYINSGAESVKSWARSSLSFGGDTSVAGTNDHAMDGSLSGSVTSKPLSYVHQDEDSKKRRMVKFRSDTKRHSRRRCGSVRDGVPGEQEQQQQPYPDSNASTHSLLDTGSATGQHTPQHHGQEIEPHNLEDDQNNSLMTQVANHILGSIGSWDAGSIMCGTDNADRSDAPFPRTASASAAPQGQHEAEDVEDDMAVEWEGQEVQLLDRQAPDCTSVASEDRMPPPNRNPAVHEQASVAFSSLGSCHSWMPEQFGSVASFLGGGGNSRAAEGMDMDHQSTGGGTQGTFGTEGFSAAGSLMGSIGGNSLTRVFENEAVPDGHSSSQVQHQAQAQQQQQQSQHRNSSLQSVGSWERSMRARSPLSIESSDDDVSLMSKDDTTVSKPEMGGNSSNSTSALPPIPLSPVTAAPTVTDADGMVWETKE